MHWVVASIPDQVKGVTFVILIFLTSFYGSIFVIFPFIPLIWLSPKVWRVVADRSVGFWLTYPVALSELIFGVKVFVSGDVIEASQPAILLMNHRTRLDWMWLWLALFKMDPWLLVSEKITLKHSLKSIFGAGWAMSAGAYLFLTRNFDQDKHKIERIISHYSESGSPTQLLLFPEGTDKGEWATKKSDEFAEKNGLQKYEYVLHPRVLGFSYLLEVMKKYKYVTSIYDITVAYSDHILQTEVELARTGKVPRYIHFNVKKYDAAPFLDATINPASFLDTCWKEKESELRAFYSQEDITKRCLIGPSLDNVDKSLFYSSSYQNKAITVLSAIVWTFFVVFWRNPFKMGEPETVTTSSILSKVGGIVLAILLILTTLLGACFFLFPLSPLMCIAPKVWRKYTDLIIGLWLVLPSGLIELWNGVKFTVTGDLVDRHHPALIIMNHRTRMDWLYFWNALYRMDPLLLASEKIVLKWPLKYLPGAGFAMSAASYVFLRRSFNKDQASIDSILKYYRDTANPYQLLLFPEGTDKDEVGMRSSNSFADKNGLQRYEYVLHPRTTGFIHILQKLRELKYITSIYDVTVGYSDRIVQGEDDMVKLGVFPKDIHFNIRKIDVKDVPEDKEGAEEWLKDVWAEKEDRLKQFYEVDPPMRNFLGNDKEQEHFLLTKQAKRDMILIIIFWLTGMSGMFFLCMSFYQIAAVGLAAVVFFVFCQICFGGIEFLQSKFVRSQ
uniref:PlsC domain-containing protein n=1 Tax=Rhabditophanes sp. KR3021 TaxID=114890 RepID=A0AC35UDM3_9BILA